MPDSRNLGGGTNPLHGSKDVVMTFPAWYSDADKFKALNDSALAKARLKCKDDLYNLTDVLSEPWSGPRINIISANIVCRSSANSTPLEVKPTIVQNSQKQSPTTPITSPSAPAATKESDQKRKCLRMGLSLGSDDYNLCLKSNPQ